MICILIAGFVDLPAMRVDVYPAGTVVWWTRKRALAWIVRPVYRIDPDREFAYYLARFEDRDGEYCVLHEDTLLEALPPAHPDFGKRGARCATEGKMN